MLPPSGPYALAEIGTQEMASARVLIPARDEAASIQSVVSGAIGAGFAVEVLDDGSRDATAERARCAGARVWSAPAGGLGKTAVLRAALQRLPAEISWVFVLDGDAQHAPADLPRFWAARTRADLVVGDRLAGAAGQMPWLRRGTNRLVSAWLARSGVRDSLCGFRLIRRAWLAGWEPVGDHFEFEAELALLATRRPTRVINLPIAAIYGAERSKIRPLRDALNLLRCFWRGPAGRFRRSRPSPQKMEPSRIN